MTKKTKYPCSLILKYINGDDINDYNIEALENDPEFMMSVINYTNDINFYKLCSDEVKNNYEFIKFLVQKFSKTNDAFIISIANEYLNTLDDDDIKYKEFVILLSEFFPNTRNYTDEIAESVYIYSAKKCTFDVLLELTLGGYNDNHNHNLGFIYIMEEYGSSEVITNHCAERFLIKIFNSEEETLEHFLHSRYKNLNTIEESGINNFIIKLVSSYDEVLANYLETHIYLIKPLALETLKVYKNWNGFERRLIKNKVETFEEEVVKYLSRDPLIKLSTLEIEVYVMNLLKLEPLYRTYYEGHIKDEIMPDEVEDDYLLFNPVNYKREFMIDYNRLGFNDRRCLRDILIVARKIFASKTKVEFDGYDSYIYSNDDENAATKTRVIKFPKKK